MKDFLNRHFTTLVVLGIFLFICFSDTFSGLRNIGKNNYQPAKIDTLSDHTVQVPQPTQYIPVYVPTPGQTVYKEIPVSAQASPELKELTAQHNQLAKDYYSQKVYKDSVQLIDSTGLKVGVVNVQDTVSKNAITSRNTSYKLSLPYRTVTIQQPYVPHNKVYGGIEVNSNWGPPNGAAIGIMFQNKRERIYKASVGIHKMPEIPLTPFYNVGAYIKL